MDRQSSLRRRVSLRRLAGAILSTVVLLGALGAAANLVGAVITGHAERWSAMSWAGVQSGAIIGAFVGAWRGIDLHPPASDTVRYVRQGIGYAAAVVVGCACLGAVTGLWIGLGGVAAWVVTGLVSALALLGASAWPGYLVSTGMRALAGPRRRFPVV